MVLLLLPQIFALSLYSAQGIAKEYMLSSETLDSEVYSVTCDRKEYFTFGFVDSKSNLTMFLPIESETGTVVYETNEKTKKIIRTARLYRNIKTKAGTNYNFLSQQLIDKVNNLTVNLQSKSAKIDGIIKANYSSSINSKCQNTNDKLQLLITELQDLKTDLVKVQKEQSLFIDVSDCSNTENLIYLYKTSFSGYNNLVSLSLNYRDSTNEIVEVVVADKNLDESKKRAILSYIEAPTALSLDISTIADSVSSTNQVYANVISDFERIGPNSPLEIILHTLKSRQDYYIAKNLLYTTDSELKNTLDIAINQILNENSINLWKDTKTVTELSQNYAQIKDLYNKGRYKESTNKIKLAKTQVKKIREAGQISIETPDISNYVSYAIIGIIVVLGAIIFMKKLKLKTKKSKKEPISKEINPEYLLNRRDPFK